MVDSKETSNFLVYKYTSLFFLSLFSFFLFLFFLFFSLFFPPSCLVHVFKDFYWTGLRTLDAHTDERHLVDICSFFLKKKKKKKKKTVFFRTFQSLLGPVKLSLTIIPFFFFFHMTFFNIPIVIHLHAHFFFL